MLQTYRMRAFDCLLCLILFAGSFASGQEAPTLRAGAAIANITPPLGELVVGGFVPFPANQIHDPLHARCLVLDDGKTRIAIVICDNLGINRDVYDEARKQISENSKIPANQILMAATHTHSATRAHEPKYRPTVVSGIAAVVDDSIQNLTPAKIGWDGIDESSEILKRGCHVSTPWLTATPFGEGVTRRRKPARRA